MLVWINNPGDSKFFALTSVYLMQDDRILAFGFMLLMILGSAMALFSSWKISLIPNKMGAMISSRLYRYYLFQDIEFHESISSTSLISKLSQ
jgi:ABC-type bacteriocin/lantibiotic exporter with double-glycine peptidase domain